MSADVITVDFETGNTIAVEKGTHSLLRREAGTAIAQLSLVERSKQEDYEYYWDKAIALGIAIAELTEEKEKPDSTVTFEEMGALVVSFRQALGQLSPGDQKKVWGITASKENFN